MHTEYENTSSSEIKRAFKNIRNYLAGQLIGATRDDSLLDETLKCLFTKLIIEKNNIEYSSDDLFQYAKNIRGIFNSVKEKYPEIFESDSEILLDPKSIKYVMEQLNFSLLNTDSDPVGDAFEIFIGAQSKGNSGQFFTPKSVINLLVNAINPQINEKVLDPACGAGGFLTTLTHHLAKSNKPTIIKSFSNENVYGIDKDSYLAKLCKTHLVLNTDSNAHIFDADSLSLTTQSGSIKEFLPKDGFDIILTNPPFGSKIIAAEENVLARYNLAYKWILNNKTDKYEITNKLTNGVPPQVLFIEQCINLLKNNGRLGIVLPESVLSNKSYSYVVDYLLSKMTIRAIVGMPEALFKTSGKGGTHTKTCIIVAEKKISTNYNIYMAEAKWCGHDSRAREIPNNDLPIIQNELLEYLISNVKPKFGFIVPSSEIKNHILCPRYYSNEDEITDTVTLKNYDFIKISSLLEDGIISYTTGDEVGKLAYGTGSIPFVRTSDISNWEIKSDPKHGISEEIYESFREKQDIKQGDILMVKDGSYLIGTCALITDIDLKMVYQSHLYKIRVNENKKGITPYLLLSLLTNSYVQKQIKSKQFTQDIIDSLGDRIKEIKLPIPKSSAERKKIEAITKQIIDLRCQAKELTKSLATSINL